MTILLPIYPINRASPWLGAMARHKRPKKAGLTKVYNNDDNDANKGNSVEVEIVNHNATRQRGKQTFHRFLLFPVFFLRRYLSKFPRRQNNVFDSAEKLHTFLTQHLQRWLFFFLTIYRKLFRTSKSRKCHSMNTKKALNIAPKTILINKNIGRDSLTWHLPYKLI